MVNMFDIFQSMLPDGVEVSKCREGYSVYTIVVQWESERAAVELRKTCAPGYERQHCMSAIINAMSTMLISKGDLVGARAWLDKLQRTKPCGEISVIKVDTTTGKVSRVYEWLDSFEDAALLCQLAMTRKQDHELIYIAPGSNKSIDKTNEELYKRALDVEKGVLEYMNED